MRARDAAVAYRRVRAHARADAGVVVGAVCLVAFKGQPDAVSLVVGRDAVDRGLCRSSRRYPRHRRGVSLERLLDGVAKRLHPTHWLMSTRIAAGTSVLMALRSEGGKRILLDNSRVYVRFLPFVSGRVHLGRFNTQLA